MELTLKKVIERYGVKNQINMAKEELAELIVALSHKERARVPIDSVIEEMADVTIMIEQLKLIYNIDSKHLQNIINKKILRLRQNDNNISE